MDQWCDCLFLDSLIRKILTTPHTLTLNGLGGMCNHHASKLIFLSQNRRKKIEDYVASFFYFFTFWVWLPRFAYPPIEVGKKISRKTQWGKERIAFHSLQLWKCLLQLSKQTLASLKKKKHHKPLFPFIMNDGINCYYFLRENSDEKKFLSLMVSSKNIVSIARPTFYWEAF